ncbi:MAG: DNA methyltransferase, partial [Promethearchaeota archaeon]
IPIINSQARERVGYPTQKPLSLLSRIIKCASRPGDLIADFFCGSGTSLVQANRLNRRWIGVDISPIAIKTSIKRLLKSENANFTLEKLSR